MEHAYAQLLHALAEHAGWALTVVFLAAFLEAVAVIGTFIPGSTILFVAGALVGTGALNLGWLFTSAVAGAVCGDGISYWIGHRYRDSIACRRPFSTHPNLLEGGRQYFAKHGVLSVVTARFFAPLRAIVPVVAGMLGMTPARFYTMNVLSALLWALAHILPGVVFGASLVLAGAVSFRLVTVIAILAAALWVSVRAVRVVLDHARNWANSSRDALKRWARNHEGKVGGLVMRMFDPARPVMGSLVALTVLVVLAAAIFFGVFAGVVSGAPLVQVDLSAYRYLQSIRSPWADAVFSVLATLGTVPTLAALVATATLLMAYERRWRTIAYWLTAVVFSQMLILVIQLSVLRAAPGHAGSDIYSFPSNHVAATVTIYGFLAFLLTRRVGRIQGMAVAAVATGIIVAVAFAGLYLGRFALSDALGGAAFAAIWVAIAGLFSVWKHPDPPPSRPHMPAVFLVMIGASVAWQAGSSVSSNAASEAPPSAPIAVSEAKWADSVWKIFPCYRSDMIGDRREPMTVQWAADPQQLEAQLESRGWIQGPRLTTRSLLSLVSPDVSATDLPALPKLNNGEPSTLVFTRSRDMRDERDVLRFWATGYAVDRRDGEPPAPIWLGSLVHERLLRPSWPFNILRPDKRVGRLIADPGKPAAWRELEVARGTGCDGMPVNLLSSDPRQQAAAANKK
ncbi:bifunctional DedA family/phosphatase PAP2 family protein [Trinickia mobilis]|uniref:bifunctional DedA family/phosphatase PAP2 family protein n=1 Tax=Trinickia mobilis TaxID=2816356 RepID=UPI001A908505|nr:bifunctional DedA family/phosphatase PAP2 family protein [Trinickia mobilis]